jgi:hypothetical protein
MLVCVIVSHNAKCVIIKTSYLEKIEFITEDCFPKHTNITTRLKQKLFSKVIREPSKEAWISLDRESN